MYSDNVIPLESAISFMDSFNHAGTTKYNLSDFMRITLRTINIDV